MEKSAMVVVMVVCMAALAAAQTSSGGVPTCAMKLAPCFTYLNSTTTPPSTCCNPIKEVVTNEKACLCSIYNNPALIEAFHINVTQALNLISLCHVNADPNLCKAEASSPSSSSVSTGTTPASPGTISTSTSATATAKLTGVDLAGLVSIALVFGGYTMF